MKPIEKAKDFKDLSNTTLIDSPQVQEATMRNSEVVAAFKTLGCEVSPFPTNNHETHFRVKGDIDGALQKIASNQLVPIRTFLENIKTCRSQIWLFKGIQR